MEQEDLNIHFECEKEIPQNIQFEIVEEEILTMGGPTVQVYEQA
jgi:hypothetical protein